MDTVAEVAMQGVEEVDVATDESTDVDVAVVMVEHPSLQARVGIATRWGTAKQSVERSSKKEEELQQEQEKEQEEEEAGHTLLRNLR
jgi:hypothetical protein